MTETLKRLIVKQNKCQVYTRKSQYLQTVKNNQIYSDIYMQLNTIYMSV